MDFADAYGAFEFRNVKPAFFFGATLVDLGGGQRAFVAAAEKALLDLVHLTDGGGTEEHLHELRLQNLERLDLVRLAALTQRASSPKLRRAERILVRLAREEREHLDS